MTPRERVLAALHHEVPDRVPRFEIWIDACYEVLGCTDPVGVYAAAGQDCVMMPSRSLPGSNAWGTGVDEWGRMWRDATYVGGAVETLEDLRRYSPPVDDAVNRFSNDAVRRARVAYPDHCLIFGTHIGPFTAAYMAMGFERFFLRLMDDPDFIRRLLEVRTEWCLAVYQRAVELGAEVLVLGDDAGSTHGPMIPPAVWREMVLPYHRQIVEALDVPVVWHSDGNVEALLPYGGRGGLRRGPRARPDRRDGSRTRHGDVRAGSGVGRKRGCACFVRGRSGRGQVGVGSLFGAGRDRRRIHAGNLQQHLRWYGPGDSRRVLSLCGRTSRTMTAKGGALSEDRQDVAWSPRVSKWKVRLLYQRVAEGMWDEELIDDVGMTLFMRCRDILRIHRAKTERVVTCPRCDRSGRLTLIRRAGSRDAEMRCPVCGWTMTWLAYQRTYKRRQLNPGGAVTYFQAFVDDYPRARTPQEKMLAVDRVIHAFHYSLKERPDVATRPAGVNLIAGKLQDVVVFLDELSGLDLPQQMAQRSQEWRETYDTSYWPAIFDPDDDNDAIEAD